MKRTVNNVFFAYFLIVLSFCVTFYGFLDLQLGFTYVDELAYFILIVVWFFTLRSNRPIIYVLIALFFYFVYSVLIQSNTVIAISTDVLIQSKPYLAFLICYYSFPYFSASQRRIFNILCYVLYLYTFAMGIMALSSGNSLYFLHQYFGGNGAGYNSAVSIIALFRFANSGFKNRDVNIFIFMLLPGLVTLRSAFFGFVFLCFFLVYFGKKITLKWSVKNFFVSIFLLTGTITVAWSKISEYFLQDEEAARLLLYQNSLKIFVDYLPFGSGLATYGTHASRLFYSTIYDKYDMSSVWGLSRDFDAFIVDTFYPSLAQIGIIGLILYILFFKFVIQLFLKNYKSVPRTPKVEGLKTVFLLSISFLFIYSVSGAVLTSTYGLSLMSVIAIIIVRFKYLARRIWLKIRVFKNSIENVS